MGNNWKDCDISLCSSTVITTSLTGIVHFSVQLGKVSSEDEGMRDAFPRQEEIFVI
jgi:hypothetical protein